MPFPSVRSTGLSTGMCGRLRVLRSLQKRCSVCTGVRSFRWLLLLLLPLHLNTASACAHTRCAAKLAFPAQHELLHRMPWLSQFQQEIHTELPALADPTGNWELQHACHTTDLCAPIYAAITRRSACKGATCQRAYWSAEPPRCGGECGSLLAHSAHGSPPLLRPLLAVLRIHIASKVPSNAIRLGKFHLACEEACAVCGFVSSEAYDESMALTKASPSAS